MIYGNENEIYDEQRISWNVYWFMKVISFIAWAWLCIKRLRSRSCSQSWSCLHSIIWAEVASYYDDMHDMNLWKKFMIFYEIFYARRINIPISFNGKENMYISIRLDYIWWFKRCHV
jgi:uncharacterized membrane protein YhaH (DUF805 family)